MRIRLYQKQVGGTFYRTIWISGRGKSTASLGTTDRAEADKLGRAFLAELLSGKAAAMPERLTLELLWRRYRTECAAFLDNKLCSRKDDAAHARVLLAVLGEAVDVRTLSARDQAAYTTRRKAGGIVLSNGRSTGIVREASVWGDLVLLHAMLNWATTVRLHDGTRLLETNPLAGVRRAKEQNPRRPIATWERFEKTRIAMQALRREAEATLEATPESSTAALEVSRWTKMELALVLAEATGRRLGSIRQLRWEDINFERREIRWRAEADKKGKEWVVPMPAAHIDELSDFRTLLGTSAGWIFAGERRVEMPMDRHLFDKWLTLAETRAKLPKLVGGLWHPYRRKWATERKHHAITDVAAAGGWKDTETLLTCYQQPDADTMLAVMSEPKKVRDVAIVTPIG
ncbi:MAG TPA: tyrosine-type recombinase/integrase [Gemmatimonadaceae bacterium]